MLKRIYIAVICLVILAAAGLLLHTYRANVLSQLNSWRLIPRPELFTELYLDNYSNLASNLPTTIAPGQQISFSFTIHNVEGKAMAYPYVVYVIDADGAKRTIEANTVSLNDGGIISIPETYTFTTDYAPAEVTVYVTLTTLNQSLHFFVPNKY